MHRFARLMLALLVLLLVAVVLFFVLENQQSVVLTFFGWAAPALPVSALVLAALSLGLVVGPLLALMASWFGRRSRPTV